MKRLAKSPESDSDSEVPSESDRDSVYYECRCPNSIYWVTIHNARNIYIRRRRVPLSEVYSSISENFHLVYTSGIEQSCVEVGASVWYS